MFDTKTVKEGQYSGQNKNVQNTTQKTKHRAMRTPFKAGVNSGIPDGKAVPA